MAHELILGGARSDKARAAAWLARPGQQALQAAPGPVVLASNEIGMGVMPLGIQTREFVDALGWLHQAVAAACEPVTWVVAGCEVGVKGSLR